MFIVAKRASESLWSSFISCDSKFVYIYICVCYKNHKNANSCFVLVLFAILQKYGIESQQVLAVYSTSVPLWM